MPGDLPHRQNLKQKITFTDTENRLVLARGGRQGVSEIGEGVKRHRLHVVR